MTTNDSAFVPDVFSRRAHSSRYSDRAARALLLSSIAAVVAAAIACSRTPPEPIPGPAVARPVELPGPTVTEATEGPAWHAARGPLMTRWAAQVSPDNALPDYPRPQLTRQRWQSLNGLWEFAELPATDSTTEPTAGRPLGARILVPYAIESALSGVMHHAERVLYRRTFQRPADMLAGERLVLHFGAVDWRATVYVNGQRIGTHSGGYDEFSYDITDALRTGDATQELMVAVFDPTDTFGQPRGKQVSKPEGIWYTPVTGIWQTVWLEPLPARHIVAIHLTPDVKAGVLRVRITSSAAASGDQVEAIASSNGKVIGTASGNVSGELRLTVPDAHLWSPEDPFLYDLTVRLRSGGVVVDSVGSYFGMRSVSIGTDASGFRRIALNGKPVFQLGPLDQGWWPDGLYTAPTDSALRFDIDMMKRLGFNVVRKHIKVEPERWYWYADHLGLAVWQDMPSGWNDTPAARAEFERELREMLDERHNHPSIVVWVPFNEKWGQFDTKRIVGIIDSTDDSRLVNDVSGWQHEGVGDIIDVHRYQGPQAMTGENGKIAVVGEFGGLGYKVNGHAWAGDTWGYGGLFPSESALADRYDLLVKRLYHDRDTHGIGAGIYTQLTDVEVELNGFFTYDRAVLKLDTARVAATNRGLAPYIVPELADFTDSVRVTIHQGTPTEIHYTIDGSAPTSASPRYDKPFIVRQTTTVRARSFVGGAPTAAGEARVDYRRGRGRTPVTVAQSSLVRGLDYSYWADTTTEPAFRMRWPVRWSVEHPTPQPNDVAPKKTGVSMDISLAPRDTSEMFAFRWTGYIRVPRTGVYTFSALSDDGAAMWIGDQNVFWSVGQSPKTTDSWGQVALQRGLHPVTISYFQAYGPMAMALYVEGPGMKKQRVPASMFFRPAPSHTPTPATRGGDTLE
ncbi:MAG: PA14 domain-containing protein [Gemmatimonadaceae bacterium]